MKCQATQPECWRNSRRRSAMTTCRRACGSTARTCCSTRWPARCPATRARKPTRWRRWRARSRNPSEASVIGGGRLSLAGATLLNGYLITATTMCDVHRATMTHVTPEVIPPALAIADERRQLRPRPPGRHRRRLRGDDADRHRHRLSGIPQARLARAGRVRAVRRRRRGRPAARLRRRHHGARLRARRQPGRRHLRGLGHADGEIPPVPRRPLRPDGGAAGRAEIRGDARVPHRQGRRPVQHLCQWRASSSLPSATSASAGSSSRSRCGCGRRRR